MRRGEELDQGVEEFAGLLQGLEHNGRARECPHSAHLRGCSLKVHRGTSLIINTPLPGLYLESYSDPKVESAGP